MNKKQRQSLILKIISQNEVETQTELQELLLKQDVSVGQATLSRDIRELRLAKRMSDSGVNCYFFEEEKPLTYNRLFAQSVVSMDYAQNIVVIKCHAGLANAACKVVDEQEFKSVVGTIAGDDTVFVITKTENFAISLLSQFRKLMTED